jgi:hypothetical protein
MLIRWIAYQWCLNEGEAYSLAEGYDLAENYDLAEGDYDSPGIDYEVGYFPEFGGI